MCNFLPCTKGFLPELWVNKARHVLKQKDVNIIKYEDHRLDVQAKVPGLALFIEELGKFI